MTRRSVPKSAPHLNGNILAAIDVETTGRLAGHHEIVQIAVVPLDDEFKPLPACLPFYTNIAPDHPERAEQAAGGVHGLNLQEICIESLDHWRIADLFDEWFENLNLPLKKKLIPLAHNWAFEAGFLKHWLGLETVDALFHPHARDSMLLAIHINDLYAARGERAPYYSVSLKNMCKMLGIKQDVAHDALPDALAAAQVYHALLQQNPII